MAKKEHTAMVTELRPLFEPIFNEECTVRFGNHQFDIIPKDIKPAAIGKMSKNVQPEKRDGKTPYVMTLTTNNEEDSLHFILEDIKVAAIFNGVRITTDAITIDIRKK